MIHQKSQFTQLWISANTIMACKHKHWKTFDMSGNFIIQIFVCEAIYNCAHTHTSTHTHIHKHTHTDTHIHNFWGKKKDARDLKF